MAGATELPAQYAETFNRLEKSRIGPRMQRALRRVAAGATYREAAAAEGYADHADVFRHARSLGLTPHRDRLVGHAKAVSSLGLQILEDRMIDDPDSISTKDAAVVTGIMLDKAARAERWGMDRDFGSGKETVFERLAEAIAPGEVDFKLELASKDPAERAIDVSGTNEPE